MKLRTYIAALQAVLLASLIEVSPVHAGSMTLLGAGKAGTVVAYAGPGDIVPSAVYWYGLRGYSAAYSTGSNPAVDLTDQVGANPVTINILSNGNLDVATIATWVAAHSVTTIKVPKLYDQSGNGFHAVNGTLSAQPTLVLNAIGARPALAFDGANSQALGVTVTTHAQPWTISASAKPNSGSTGGFAGVFTPNTSFGPTISGNLIHLIAGTDVSISDTFGSFRVYQGVANGASSSIKIDTAAPTTLNAGTSGLGTFNLIGQEPGGSFMTGNILNIGWWASAISPTDQAAIQAQDKAYWGF